MIKAHSGIVTRQEIQRLQRLNQTVHILSRLHKATCMEISHELSLFIYRIIPDNLNG